MKVLEHYGIDCTGKKVVVIGRSLVVGKPAAMMLLKKNATVTVCHTRTVDMPSVVKEADIVVVAAGKAGVIDGSYLREGQIVIDVGINVNEEGKLCGDVNFEEAAKDRRRDHTGSAWSRRGNDFHSARACGGCCNCTEQIGI